jgi:hypothetical protein
MTLRELRQTFDQVPEEALREALSFEGVDVAA